MSISKLFNYSRKNDRTIMEYSNYPLHGSNLVTLSKKPASINNFVSIDLFEELQDSLAIYQSTFFSLFGSHLNIREPRIVSKFIDPFKYKNHEDLEFINLYKSSEKIGNKLKGV